MLFPTVVMPMVFTTPSWLTRLSGVAVHIIAPGSPVSGTMGISVRRVWHPPWRKPAGAGRQDDCKCGWTMTADSTNLAEVAVAQPGCGPESSRWPLTCSFWVVADRWRVIHKSIKVRVPGREPQRILPRPPPRPGFCTRFTAKFNPVTVSRSIPAKPIIRSPLVGLDSSSTVPKAL